MLFICLVVPLGSESLLFSLLLFLLQIGHLEGIVFVAVVVVYDFRFKLMALGAAAAVIS